MATIEAMRAGLPIVCSDVDGLKEDVRDGVDGVLVPPGDASALAAALVRVLNDRRARTRFGTAARARFDDRFDADVFASSLRAIYDGEPPSTS